MREPFPGEEVRGLVVCRRNANIPDVGASSLARCGLVLVLAVDFLAWVAARPTVGIGVLQGRFKARTGTGLALGVVLNPCARRASLRALRRA